MNVIDPMAAGLAGFQMGQQNRMTEQNQQINVADAAQRQAMNAQGMAQNDQQMRQSATEFDQSQQDRALSQQAAAQEAVRAQQFQADQMALITKAKSGSMTAADIAELGVKYPEMSAGIKESFADLSADRRKADAFELAKAMAALKAGRPEIAIKMLEDRAVAAENSGLADEAGMSRAMIEQIKMDPALGLMVGGLALHELDPESAKLVLGAGDETPADIRSLQWRAKEAGLVPGTPEYQAFISSNGGKDSGDVPASFRALELQAEAAGLVPGTPEYQQFMATKGAGLVAQAGAEGKAAGENKTLLESMKSKMPGLELVVGTLDDLADKATYTAAGQLADAARKQAGMDPRPEAVARAEYIAMVDAQVLPLLRDTFGAAFTQKEGDTLRATLGDPDKSPAEKKAVLRSFIAQKKRDVEALESQVSGGSSTQTPTISSDTEYEALPSGTEFIAPDGSKRRKP
jgi:hypothetical protein